VTAFPWGEAMRFGFGTVAGPFQITALQFSGDYTGEVTFDLALDSAGELTFTAN
jgi:predicted secreted protein